MNPHSADLFLSLWFQKPHTLAPLVIWTHGTTGSFPISHPFQSVGGGSFRVWQDGVYRQPFTEQSRILCFHMTSRGIHIWVSAIMEPLGSLILCKFQAIS